MQKFSKGEIEEKRESPNQRKKKRISIGKLRCFDLELEGNLFVESHLSRGFWGFDFAGFCPNSRFDSQTLERGREEPVEVREKEIMT